MFFGAGDSRTSAWSWLQEEHDLIAALIQHPNFPDKVNDIVVVFGNTLYQNILDRYIAGENVALTEIRPVWRNTGFSPLAPWDAPVYESCSST